MNKYQYSCFKRLDIFGVAPLFTIRGRPTFQTQIGSCLTILCIFLMGIYVLVFLNQMINHKSPDLQSSIYYDEIPQEIQLNKNNFSFAFGLQTKDYENYIDDSIYNVKAHQIKLEFIRNGIYNYEDIPLKLINCSQYNFEMIPEFFKKLPLNNLYCIDNDINLKGEFKKEYWNYIRLNFSKCENSTENGNKCKSEEEINKLLSAGYIGIFIPDYSFEPTKYSSPYSPYIKNLYKAFSIKYFEDIFFYFKIVQIITDSGYFFEDKKTIKFATFDYTQNDIDFRESNHFLSLTIRVSSKREIFQRSYIKLQEIFSNVGGMLKIVLLAGEYSVYFIRMLLYKNYILEFFNLDESEIRLKEVRKIYNLQKGKTNLDTLFSNISKHSIGNNNLQIIEEKSESGNNNDNSECSNKDSKQGSFILSNKNNKAVENNFLLQNKGTYSFLNSKKETKIMLYRGATANVNNYSSKKNSKTLLPHINLPYDRQKSAINNLKRNTIISNSGRNFEGQKMSFFNNNINNNNNNSTKSSKRKSMISIDHFNFDKQKNNIPELNILNKNSLKNNNFMPKTQLRVIKVPGFCADFVCKKNTFKTIKQVHENYKEIQFLLDIVHYLKSENELNIIEKYFFTEEQRKILSYTYSFEADFKLEREGYDYMIKHEKNKFDDKEVNETCQKSLLNFQNKNDI